MKKVTYKITAVIVTNNRLQLLREAIRAVQHQYYPLLEIIVVNNASTDGTTEWLNVQSGLHVINQENSGGSGGFYTGIAEALKFNPDWVWVMDDDTIINPNSLEILVNKLSEIQEPVGFIGSKCVWTDGTPHLMNIPAVKPSFNKKIPFNKFDSIGLILVETSSFVSLLINAESVKSIGLPYKDFFIWGDDQEYTKRITATGVLGFYCSESIVLHKTGVNYFADFYNDSTPNLWKHSYGFRNEFFMIKKRKGFIYFILWLLIKLPYTTYKLLSIRKTDRIKFLGTLWRSGWNAIFFNPKIDFVR